MCGIAGFTRLGGRGDNGVAQRITEALYHRGPDQSGIFEGNLATLCAVRLKIIDLDGGDQPIVSDDGDTAIAFNGEIYNHGEIRAELERLGHRFHSQCDTETVLHAFRQWDTACFQRMRGMFGVALWTRIAPAAGAGAGPHGHQAAVLLPARRRCLLRLGAEGHSGAPAKCRGGWIWRRWTAIFGQLRAGPANADRGHAKVPPGHLLEWRHGRMWLEPWWKLEAEAAPRGALEEAKEELDGLLTRRRSRAPGGGRAAGRVGFRGHRFLDHSALRGGGVERAAEDLFGVVSRDAASMRAGTFARSRRYTARTTTSSS